MEDNKVFESALNQQGDVDFVRGLKDGKSVKIHVETLLGKAKITQQIAEAKQQITEEGNTQVQRVKNEGAVLNEKVTALERQVNDITSNGNGYQKVAENGFFIIDSEGYIGLALNGDDAAKFISFSNSNFSSRNVYDALCELKESQSAPTDMTKSLRIVFFGNSFTADALSLWKVLRDEYLADYDVTVGYVYLGGASLLAYDMCYSTDSYSMGCHILKKGKTSWESVSGNFQRILSEGWDVVCFQQQSSKSMNWETYSPHIQNLINKVYSKASKTTKIGFLLTTPLHGSDRGLSNFQGQADAAKKLIENTNVEYVIPCGTALQNARSIDELNNIGQGMTDGSHLANGIGYYIEGVTIVEWIYRYFGIKSSVFGSTFVPNGSTEHLAGGGTPNGYSERNCRIAQIAAIAANNSPYTNADLNGYTDYFDEGTYIKFIANEAWNGASVGSSVVNSVGAVGFTRTNNIRVKQGDQFKITGTGSSGMSRLWAWLNSECTVISIADSAEVATDKVITAPSGASYLIASFKDANYSLQKL